METFNPTVAFLLVGIFGLVIVVWLTRQARKGVDEFGASQPIQAGLALAGDFQNLFQQLSNEYERAKRPEELQAIEAAISQLSQVVKNAIAQVSSSLPKMRENSAVEEKLAVEFKVRADQLADETDLELREALLAEVDGHKQTKAEIDEHIKKLLELIESWRKLSSRIDIQLGRVASKRESLTRLNDSIATVRMQVAQFGGLVQQDYMGRVNKIEQGIHDDASRLTKMLDRVTGQANASLIGGSVGSASDSLLEQADRRIAARKAPVVATA